MPSDKFEADAKRMKSRGFGGYAADRILGRADFAKAVASTAAADEAAPYNARQAQIDAAEQRALGADGTYATENANRGSSIRGQ